MRKQVKFLVMVAFSAFVAFGFLALNTALVFSSEKTEVTPITAKGKDLVNALNGIKGITLYDYAELYSNTIVFATFFIEQETFKKEGFMSVKQHIIKILVTRYLDQDKKRGVNSYMIAVLADPNVVIEFEILGEEINTLKKQFKMKPQQFKTKFPEV